MKDSRRHICAGPLSLIWRVPVALLLFVLTLLVALEFSPIYRFAEPQPFAGECIYNPYASLDTAAGWKRANFHTHTRVDNILNECELYPDSVLACYRKFGYDIVSFSNHMQLTEYPGDPSRQIWVYEHGFNIGKLHNLVFNPRKVHLLDCSAAFFPSLQQFKIDRLTRDADFVVLNHPDRTFFMSDRTMASLTGYRVMEAVSGFADKYTYGERWDIALSAGHYAPSAISDDLHHPDKTRLIARRCSFLNTPSETWPDISATLLSGNFYSMYLPDYGSGDWAAKYAANADLPSVESVGLRDSATVYLNLSRPAATIEAIGQGGERLATFTDTPAAEYTFRPEDTYVRLVARYEDGCVIYCNPFARWSGSSASGTPYVEAEHTVRIGSTMLYNVILLCLAFWLAKMGCRVLKLRKGGRPEKKS